MAQVVYYVTAAAALGGRPRRRSRCPRATSATSAPAGWPARWACPIDRLVVGSNRNDILTRFFAPGIMATAEVVPTLSPSMDIQVSSNFERLLFELNGRDGGLTAEQLRQLPGHGPAGRRGRPAGSLARAGLRRRPVRRRGDAGRRSRDGPRRRPACSSTPTPPSASAPPAGAAARARRGHGRAGHGPPGQVPRRRRARHRRAPPLPDHLADLLERPERTQVVVAERPGAVEAVVARSPRRAVD